jgi:ribulose-phosphate 3-epimerase
MQQKSIIAPSLLSADFARLGEQIAEAEAHGADRLHLDVMDGHFVPNITMGPVILAACRRVTRLPLDVHLMIEAPERMIPAFAKAGADLLTVHVEACPHLHRTLSQIRENGARPGVALNPGTPAASVVPVLHLVDLVLVMSVNPGFSAQAFLPEVLPKVAFLRQELDRVNPAALIEMDGGIAPETAARCHAAGTRVFTAGSAIFNHPGGIGAGIRALRAALPG